MRNYRDLEVWHKAHNLTLDLYRRSRRFPKEEFYGLTSQMRGSAISVGANLAEGCGRQTTAELARFVRISMGSASELDLPPFCWPAISGIYSQMSIDGYLRS